MAKKKAKKASKKAGKVGTFAAGAAKEKSLNEWLNTGTDGQIKNKKKWKALVDAGLVKPKRRK
jgi:hypothetical protein